MTNDAASQPQAERASVSRARGIASALFGTVLFAVVFLTGLSETAVRAGRPDLALALIGADGMAANAYLEPHGSEKSVQQAGGLARTALNHSYTHVAAIRTLGLLAEAQGNHDAASALINNAARWGWRDTSTQFWLLQEGVKNGEYGDIFDRADSLLRRGYLQKELFAVFRIAAMDPELRPHFTNQLATAPGWRLPYFQASLDTPPAQLAGQVAVADALRLTDAPLKREELNPLTLALIKAGQGAAAFDLWSKQFAEGKLDPAHLALRWPSAEAQAAPGPFDWRIAEAFQVNAQIDAGDETNRLTVVTDTSSVGPVADRTLALAPGSYSFAGDGPHGTDARYWRWAVSCDGFGKLWQSDDGKGNGFSVPAGCTTQRLTLSLNGRADMVVGETWFGPITISKL